MSRFQVSVPRQYQVSHGTDPAPWEDRSALPLAGGQSECDRPAQTSTAPGDSWGRGAAAQLPAIGTLLVTHAHCCSRPLVRC